MKENDLYIHIDNGGYEFSYDKEKEIIKIETSFYGYSANKHYFDVTL